MKVLLVVPPTPLAVKMVEMALRISRDIVFVYASGATNPVLEQRVIGQGAKLITKTERGELTTDSLRVAAIENVDMIIVPDRFSKNANGISKASEAMVSASPVDVLVVK